VKLDRELPANVLAVGCGRHQRLGRQALREPGDPIRSGDQRFDDPSIGADQDRRGRA
jgi:hypothetical protein